MADAEFYDTGRKRLPEDLRKPFEMERRIHSDMEFFTKSVKDAALEVLLEFKEEADELKETEYRRYPRYAEKGKGYTDETETLRPNTFFDIINDEQKSGLRGHSEIDYAGYIETIKDGKYALIKPIMFEVVASKKNRTKLLERLSAQNLRVKRTAPATEASRVARAKRKAERLANQ